VLHLVDEEQQEHEHLNGKDTRAQHSTRYLFAEGLTIRRLALDKMYSQRISGGQPQQIGISK
jgi:ABC-type dipeptide/oligopeptide/nickel transport system ATPase subunit